MFLLTSQKMFLSSSGSKFFPFIVYIRRTWVHESKPEVTKFVSLGGNGRESTECIPLRKHAYSNILKILQPKKENFQIKKKSDFFHISAQNKDLGTR